MRHSVQLSKRSGIRLLCDVLLIAAPFLLLAGITLFTGNNAFAPNPVWADEADCYRSVLSYVQSGLPTAANGSFESTAYQGHFGSLGIVPMLLYGLFGKVFGVSRNLIVLANAFWISAAMLVFVVLRKPQPKLALLLFLSFITYVPVILYCTTSMTELFSYALVLFYLAFLLTYHERRKPWALILCLLTAMLACVYRTYYGWLMLPLALTVCRFRFNVRTVITTALFLLLGFGCCLLSTVYTAPNYSGFFYHLRKAESLSVAWRMFLSHAKMNVDDLIFHNDSLPLETLLILTYLAVMGLSLVSSFVRINRSTPRPSIKAGFRGDCFGLFLLMAALLLTDICLLEVYDWRGYRILAPIVWLATAYFVSRRHIIIPIVTFAMSFVSFVWLILNPATGAFGDPDRFAPRADNAAIVEAAQLITYAEADPDATRIDPFDNAVRTDLYSPELVENLDPRLGMQFGWLSTDTVERSRWLITDRLRCAVTGYENVATLDGCNVYRRLDIEETGE